MIVGEQKVAFAPLVGEILGARTVPITYSDDGKRRWVYQRASPALSLRSHSGVIVERGTHDGLLRQDGLYASMWNRQRQAAEAAEILREVEEGEGRGAAWRGPLEVREPVGVK